MENRFANRGWSLYWKKVKHVHHISMSGQGKKIYSILKNRNNVAISWELKQSVDKTNEIPYMDWLRSKARSFIALSFAQLLDVSLLVQSRNNMLFRCLCASIVIFKTEVCYFLRLVHLA